MVLTSRQRRTKHSGVHTAGIAWFTMLLWMGRRIIRYAIFQTCGRRLQPQVMQPVSRMRLKQLADLKIHSRVTRLLPASKLSAKLKLRTSAQIDENNAIQDKNTALRRWKYFALGETLTNMYPNMLWEKSRKDVRGRTKGPKGRIPDENGPGPRIL
ncbi:uncharacterized protein [Dermacentor albipictus]|uniref:uncharacterized protein isoform X1 n=1 Tax=Dermacentor albipictus TaxID=60249 RepID=UPI0038FC9524